MDTLPLLGQGAVWWTALPFASTRAWTCRMTAASTSTMVRVRHSVAPLPSCTLPCCPGLWFWTQEEWRTALIVLGLMLCGRNGCSRPTWTPSSWGLGVLGTGQDACFTLATLLTATQTFVCTAKHYVTVRVSVATFILILTTTFSN